MSRRPYDLAKQACCGLIKADIPEVLSVIRLLEPIVFRRATIIERQALAEGLRRVAQVTPEEVEELRENPEDLALLLAGIILLIERIVQREPNRALVRRIRRSVTSLFDDGARSVGRTTNFSRRTLLAQAAETELLLLLQGGVTFRTADVERILREFLLAAPTLVQSVQTARQPNQPPRSQEEFQDDLLAALGLSERDVALAIDGWAYRWYSVAAVAAVLSSPEGGTLVHFNNPPVGPDSSSSAFCRWIHKKPVDLEAARAQLDRHVRLAQSGDTAGIISNWPFLSSNVARRGTVDDFQAFMGGRAVIGPFHHGCRTVPRPST